MHDKLALDTGQSEAMNEAMRSATVRTGNRGSPQGTASVAKPVPGGGTLISTQAPVTLCPIPRRWDAFLKFELGTFLGDHWRHGQKQVITVHSQPSQF